jgi:hypothetical protein
VREVTRSSCEQQADTRTPARATADGAPLDGGQAALPLREQLLLLKVHSLHVALRLRQRLACRARLVPLPRQLRGVQGQLLLQRPQPLLQDGMRGRVMQAGVHAAAQQSAPEHGLHRGGCMQARAVHPPPHTHTRTCNTPACHRCGSPAAASPSPASALPPLLRWPRGA